VFLNRVKGKPMSMSQGSRRATKRVKGKMRIQPQRGHRGTKSAAEIPLSENVQGRSRTIRKKRVLRMNREEGLKGAKGHERAQGRAWNRNESDSSRLVKTLQSLGPPEGHNQSVRKKKNVPPTKVSERIKRGGSGRSKIGNTEHGQEGQRKGRTI
jgi:hypothetical protein